MIVSERNRKSEPVVAICTVTRAANPADTEAEHFPSSDVR